jgi:hypothetical protein
MGGRLWACKHGKNDEDMTGAAHRAAATLQRHRVKDFTREIGASENDLPIPAQSCAKCLPICIGGI